MLVRVEECMDQRRIAIIGSGIAGVSSALWCKRLGMNPVLIEESERIGGQLHRIYDPIPDYPGFYGRGDDFALYLKKQLDDLKIHIRTNQRVIAIKPEGLELIATGGRSGGEREFLEADGVIVATGLRNRKLNLIKEDLEGVFYSASAIRDQFKEKVVAIVGGGDGAFENAWKLSSVARRIHLLVRSNRIRARSELQGRVRERSNIEIHTETVISEIKGEGHLEALTLVRGHKEFNLEVQRLLIKVGFEPVTDFVQGFLQTDGDGFIQVFDEQKTSQQKVRAAGDVCTPVDPGLAVGAGQGCVAARSLLREFEKKL